MLDINSTLGCSFVTICFIQLLDLMIILHISNTKPNTARTGGKYNYLGALRYIYEEKTQIKQEYFRQFVLIENAVD